MNNDDEMDLKSRIRQYLTTDPQFRNPAFDPAPYLIQILKDKSADHEAMIEKQQQLIEQQNKARQLIDEVCSEHSAQFLKFVEIPAAYAQNLQKLKSNVSVVKKKVKQTKALLLNTQKDIQQIHYNCMYNKIVYKELKNIQVRLQQYQTAFLALKNNQFYLCALNLPFVEGLSILQSTLAARSETLRLRMMSKAIDQLILFLFFSPKIILPSSNVYLDRISSQEKDKNTMSNMIANWQQQQAFLKRYKLFKKADCLQYLNKIWDFSDLDRKEGKLGLMFDIIKGIIRIGKINDITSSIQMYGPKQISNIFLLLKCFRYKQQIEEQQKNSKPKVYRWFIDRCNENAEDKAFISATLNIIGVVLRKAIIIHRIYQQFQQKEFPLNSAVIYKLILVQLKKLIDLLYFPQKSIEQGLGQNTDEQLNNQIKTKLSKYENYINYGHSCYIISQSLILLQRYISDIQEKHFQNNNVGKDINKRGAELLSSYDQLFYTYFHRDFIHTLQEIFGKENHSFIVQSFQVIISYKAFSNDQIKYMKGYRSDDRKAIRQYIYLLSFMKALEQFFEKNKLSKQRLYKYLVMSILFFYLKLNHHILCNLISSAELLVIDEQRKSDKKLKKKEDQIKRIYQKIFTQKQIKQQKFDKYDMKSSNKKFNSSNMAVSFHTTDKLKIIHKQNQMLLSFSCLFFSQIQQFKNGQNVTQFVKMIGKLEPANYDEQAQPKLIRVWDTLPDSQKSLKQYVSAILYKFIQLQCVIMTKIYRETGTL